MYLKKKFGFDKVTIAPSPGGNLAPFQSDPKLSMQCFVTSEPLAAKKAGVKVKSFLIVDSGYNPYTTLLVAKSDYIKNNPEVVKKMVAAVREGWEAYLADPKPANEVMRKLRPDMDEQTFAESAEAQKDLILTAETKASGLGTMTKARWETLIQQLIDVGVIKNAPPVDQCFIDVAKLP
jgi:NitT/TauT family transport system substrate-binding protein